MGDSTDAAVTFIGPLALVGVGAVSLWSRWRHAADPTRQQVKWLAFAASAFGIELALAFISALTHSMGDDASSYYIGDAVFILTVCLIPAAMGVGIVRHHLYDIDKLLSRTIAYGLILVAAALIYVTSIAVFAGVLASRDRFRPRLQ
jgi:hypothetical protein